MENIKKELLNTLEDLVEEDLKRFQWHLINTVEGSTKIPKARLKNTNRQETVDKMVARLGKCKAVEVTLDVLKNMNQNQLAEELGTKYRQAIIWENPKVKENLKIYFLDKFARLSDRTSLEDDSLLLKDIYTELYVIEGCTGGVNTEHEIRQIEAIYPKSKETSVRFSDLFKVQPDQSVHGTKVLTVGIGGVGKTATVHKFILDWAENKSNQDLDFVFFLPFRELNVIKGEKYSLLDLLNYFHCELCDEDEMKMLKCKANMIIILDGLDENKIQLDFNQKKVSSVTEKTTPDKLITNLIKGELLPSALIWITSRPAAASQIPCRYFHYITEIRGFDDSQKEEYFKKRMNDEHQVSRIISHIKSVRSLHILCHIPVFCKIAATVLQKGLDGTAMENAPTTMTEMYTHFLLFQTRQKSEKYSTKENEDSPIPPVERGSLKESDILKLGKLAFLQLQKGKQIFFESDLKKCGIDVNEAAVYSGVCTQFFKREEKLFSFVHLSFQEFLAAVFVFVMFASCTHNKLLQTILEKIKWMFRHELDDLLKTAVEKAMESKKGHLDLFVRFLLGLSLQSNQRLLKAIHPELEIKEESLKDTTDYIKKKIKKTKSSEKIINLFHCLSEMKDITLTSEIQNYLNSVDFTAEEFSPTQWSALVFMLLMSEDTQQKFELKIYRPSDEGLRRLLPVVKNTRQALLDHCNLTEDSCKTLASGFSSTLKVLDLSNNNMQDSGVKELCDGLKCSNCKLEKLRLSGCLITEKGCCFLASVLASVFSSALKELDLSNNDLKDSGVQELCEGLKNSHCKLEILRLSGCLVTEKSCSYLASALNSNPSHLKELDLTYNHPGDSGIELLSTRQKDTHCRLETLRVEHAGENRIKPGLRKYACKITLDPNTAHTQLTVSEGNRKVVCVREHQSYPDHPDRFDDLEQVLSKESVNGRCYWEADWSNEAEIAVTYKGIHRKGSSDDCMFGLNEQSWSLIFSNNSYSVWHNQKRTNIPNPTSPSNRAGVYVDWPAGTLSFYSVSSDTQALTHLYTFQSKFTEPLYAGFRVGHDSPVCVCEI